MDDIVNLSARQVYLRLCIDGAGSRPFSAKTLAPIPEPEHNFVPATIATSRAMYGRERHIVEEYVKDWYKPIVQASSPRPVPAQTPTPTPTPTQHQTTSKPVAQTYTYNNRQASEKRDDNLKQYTKPTENRSQDRKIEDRQVEKPKVTSQSVDNKKQNNALRDALNVALGVENTTKKVEPEKIEVKKEDIKNTKTVDEQKIKDILDL
jgi:hypothetical protein